jgi:hypothetical protein
MVDAPEPRIPVSASLIGQQLKRLGYPVRDEMRRPGIRVQKGGSRDAVNITVRQFDNPADNAPVAEEIAEYLTGAGYTVENGQAGRLAVSKVAPAGWTPLRFHPSGTGQYRTSYLESGGPIEEYVITKRPGVLPDGTILRAGRQRTVWHLSVLRDRTTAEDCEFPSKKKAVERAEELWRQWYSPDYAEIRAARAALADAEAALCAARERVAALEALCARSEPTVPLTEGTTVQIRFDDTDFDKLWDSAMEWTADMAREDCWEEVASTSDDFDLTHWSFAYVVPADWSRVILMRSWLEEKGQSYDVLWDTDEQNYVILTDYPSTVWAGNLPEDAATQQD